MISYSSFPIEFQSLPLHCDNVGGSADFPSPSQHHTN